MNSRFVSRCTLELGGELVTVAEGATLEAEYALFDAGEIELSATAPGTIRETGYRTTAGEARSRLAQLGATRELAEEAAAVAKVWIARAYARGAAVRRIVDKLDAAELFDGRAYDSSTGRYLGAWLELPELASTLDPAHDPGRTATNLQALHLAALLAERPEDETVALATSEVTAQRRPGERTYKRVVLDRPEMLVRSLGALKHVEREGPETGPGRLEIVGWLRARARRVPAAGARLASIEAALAARDAPTRGPLADADLWALETRLSLGETAGMGEKLDALERRRGRLPGTAYLRARVALMTRAEEPRAVAERVSDLSASMSAFHELQLLAAQAWAEAGDVRRAHAFARDLLENTAACDALRMRARDVLDATIRATTAPEGGVPLIPKPPLPPSDTQPHMRVAPRSGPIDETHARERPDLLLLDMSVPSFRVEVRTDRSPSIPPERAVETEAAETLSVPSGMRDEAPPHDEPPRTPPAARLFCTYLARELARELRMRHGPELRCDLEGLELAQRYLREAIASEEVRTAEDEREVMRHGAFLSELLARKLGGRWIDLEPGDPARWAMLVTSRSRPNEVCRTWPFGRVLRFVAQKHRERDLVSYYLQVEAQAR